MVASNAYIEPCLVFGPLVGFPALLEVDLDAFPGLGCKLWELPCARVHDGLDLLLGLARNGDLSVKILIHKKTHKHLRKNVKKVSTVYNYFL